MSPYNNRVVRMEHKLKILKIVLHRCDEKPKLKSTVSSKEGHSSDIDIGLAIKSEDCDYESSYSDEYADIPQNNTNNFTFGDDLEALLKSEPEDYHFQPVTETITFYSATTAASAVPIAGSPSKLNVHAKVEHFEDEFQLESDEHLEDPLAMGTGTTVTTGQPVPDTHCKICSIDLKSSLDLRIHEVSVHGYNRSGRSHVFFSGGPPSQIITKHKTKTHCPICGKSLVDSDDDMYQHLKIVHNIIMSSNSGSKSPSCTKSSTKSGTKNLPMGPLKPKPIRRCLPTRFKERPTIVCPICQKKFNSSNVHRHWRDVHKLNAEARREMYKNEENRIPEDEIEVKVNDEEPILDDQNLEDLESFSVQQEQLDDQNLEESDESVEQLLLDDSLEVQSASPGLDISRSCGEASKSSLDLQEQEISAHSYDNSELSHDMITKGHVPRQPRSSQSKPNFRCPICQKSSSERSKVHRHMRGIHRLSYEECFRLFPLSFRKTSSKIYQDYLSSVQGDSESPRAVDNFEEDIESIEETVEDEDFDENEGGDFDFEETVGQFEQFEDELPFVKLYDPLATPSPLAEIKCTICGIGSKSLVDIQKHEINVHGFYRNISSSGSSSPTRTEDMGHVVLVSTDVEELVPPPTPSKPVRPSRPKHNFQCPICKKCSFIERRNVHNHMHKVHRLPLKKCWELLPYERRRRGLGHGEDETSVPCSMCPKIFDTRAKVRRHWREVHQLRDDLRRKLYKQSLAQAGPAEEEDTPVAVDDEPELYVKVENFEENVDDFEQLSDPLSFHLPQEPVPVPLQLEIKCKLCGLGCKSSLDLRIHEIIAHSYNRSSRSHVISRRPVRGCSSSFQCIFCDETFADKPNVRIHMHNMHDLPYNNCLEYFPMSARGQGQGQGRVRSAQHSGAYFSCPVCEKMCYRRNQMRLHVERAHPEFGVAQELNPESSGQEGQGQDQDLTTTDHFLCPICQNMFITPINMHRHWRVVHKIPKDERSQMYAQYLKPLMKVNENNLESYTCPICKNVLSHKCNMRRHFRQVHLMSEEEIDNVSHRIESAPYIVPRGQNSKKDYPCPLCNNRLACYTNLPRHFQQVHKFSRQQARAYYRSKYMLELHSSLKSAYGWTGKTNNLNTNICKNVSESEEVGCDQIEFYSRDLTAVDPLSISDCQDN